MLLSFLLCRFGVQHVSRTLSAFEEPLSLQAMLNAQEKTFPETFLP
jgi:hypothetical protein